MQAETQIREMLSDQRIAAISASLSNGVEKREAKKKVREIQRVLQFLAPSISPFRPAYRVGEEKVLAAYQRRQLQLGRV